MIRSTPRPRRMVYDSELREGLRHASPVEIADTFDPVEPEEPESGTLPRECPPASAPGSTHYHTCPVCQATYEHDDGGCAFPGDESYLLCPHHEKPE